MSFSQIAAAIGAGAPPASLNVSGCVASGWSIDSRTTQPGDCFFALRGARDGHEFVATAFERGAAVAVVDRDMPGAAGPLLQVRDTQEALTQLGSVARTMWGGTVIGVTGSAGKTSTKDAVAELVGSAFPTGRTIGNFNNHLGVPLSILRLPAEAKVGVLEMGMNHAEEIRGLARLARPSIGVVTNAGWAHAENFPDGIDGVARAKRELIEELPADGIAVLNADDDRVRDFAKVHSGRSILYGFAESAEVRAEDVELSDAGAKFRALGIKFESPLAGRHGVSNVLAAISAARALGINAAQLRPAVRALRPGYMRGERSLVNGVTVINDCYNANPEAMRSMLELLAGIPARRRIAVLGEMLELGREAETLHREIGKFAAEQGIHAVIGIRGAARFTVDEAVKAGTSVSAAYFFSTPEEAGEFVRDFVQPGDAVLFKGSRGVQVEKALERAFGKGGPRGLAPNSETH